jgi:hypothetical protein
VVVTENLLFPIAVGAAQITNLFPGPAHAAAIQRESNEAAVLESFVALGLTHGRDHRLPRDPWVEPRGEIAEGVVPEAPGNVQGASPRTDQRFNAREGRAAEHHPHQQSPQQGGGGNAPLRAAIARRA